VRKSDSEMEDLTIITSAEGFYCPGFSESQEAVLTQTPTAAGKSHWRGARNFWLVIQLSGNC